MEIYLCHIAFYRVLEKLHLTRICENEIASYAISVVAVIIMSTAFSFAVKKFFEVTIKVLNRSAAQND